MPRRSAPRSVDQHARRRRAEAHRLARRTAPVERKIQLGAVRCRVRRHRSRGRGIRRSRPSRRSGRPTVGADPPGGSPRPRGHRSVCHRACRCTRAPPMSPRHHSPAVSAGDLHQVAVAHELGDVGVRRAGHRGPPACRSAASGRRSAPRCGRRATAPPPGRASHRWWSSRAWRGCAGSRRASPAAAWHPGSTAARPSAPAAAPTTMARAIATRCCWPPESWPGSLSACVLQPHERQRLVHPPRDLAPSAGAAWSGRSRCCAAPSCAGTARSSGTPCRSRAPPARARRCADRPARSRRRSAAAARRCSSARWTCRSPTGRAGRRTRPARPSAYTSRSACSWPKSRLIRSSRSSRKSRERDRHARVTCRPARRPAGPSAGTRRPACPRAAAPPTARRRSACRRRRGCIRRSASWLSCGAIDSGTSFTAGPG